MSDAIREHRTTGVRAHMHAGRTEHASVCHALHARRQRRLPLRRLRLSFFLNSVLGALRKREAVKLRPFGPLLCSPFQKRVSVKVARYSFGLV